MTGICVAVLMAGPLAAPAMSQGRPTAGDATLAAVQAHIRAVTTMTADFVQTDARGQVTTGRLLWKQPGRIRFQYGGGVPLLIVADGRSLTMIDYEVKQVQRWPIRNSPLGALLDPTRDITRYGRIAPTGDPRVLSVDVRDPGHPEYGVITLVLRRAPDGPAGLILHGWAARDAQGNRTSVRLSGQSYGTPIADIAFRWRDPRPATRGGAR